MSSYQDGRKVRAKSLTMAAFRFAAGRKEFWVWAGTFFVCEASSNGLVTVTQSSVFATSIRYDSLAGTSSPHPVRLIVI